MLDNYTLIHGSESHGRYGSFGLKILVAGSNLPPLDDHSEEAWPMRRAGMEAADIIEKAVRERAMQLNPDAHEAARKEREQLIGLFPETIFVKELPNGYCSDWCCKHLPWFEVITRQGPIQIGWRKRVINIDWSQMPLKRKAEVLFSGENVTKGDYHIHAWSPEDAARYIQWIIASATPVPELPAPPPVLAIPDAKT